MKRRVILIVLDSVGIGELPDAASFGDVGSHTLGNIYKSRGYLALPNLYSLGLANIENSRLPIYSATLKGSFGRAAERTAAKDTTSGHWEIAGLPMEKPFRTYPKGFPLELIKEFEQLIGRKTLGNVVASGTEIIMRLGYEHVRTGKPIVYTSADSVFQIAAHEEVISLEEQYKFCEIARKMLVGEHLVGRVIARPFLGKAGEYRRTENRKDYAIAPPGDTILDALVNHNLETVGIGKIEDIFHNRGITISDHTRNNKDSIRAVIKYILDDTGDFIFANLVDFDMLYGHRNDVNGYASALEYFDVQLATILQALKKDDLLIITADHGCDPTTKSTDHSREYVPILITGSNILKGVNLGTRDSFSDIGATVYEYLSAQKWAIGSSFLSSVIK